MKKNSQFVALFLIIFGLIYAAAFGMEGRYQDDPKVADILASARDIMESAGYCFLITQDEAGNSTARIMDPFPPEQDMKVWMGTNKNTRKVQHIRNRAACTLAYYNQKGMSYVTLMGTARLVSDPARKTKWWKEEWSSFYPGKSESEVYLLIEFMPAQIEVMDIPHKVLVSIFRPEILSREDSAWVRKK